MSDNSNDTGAFLAGFVIGGLVGAAVALIMAPQSGEETRARIASNSANMRQVGAERFQEVRSRADDYTQDYRGRAGDYVSSARTAAEQAQERARIVLDEGKTRFGGVIETGKGRASQVREDVVNPGQAAEENDEGDAPETA